MKCYVLISDAFCFESHFPQHWVGKSTMVTNWADFSRCLFFLCFEVSVRLTNDPDAWLEVYEIHRIFLAFDRLFRDGKLGEAHCLVRILYVLPILRLVRVATQEPRIPWLADLGRALLRIRCLSLVIDHRLHRLRGRDYPLSLRVILSL